MPMKKTRYKVDSRLRWYASTLWKHLCDFRYSEARISSRLFIPVSDKKMVLLFSGGPRQDKRYYRMSLEEIDRNAFHTHPEAFGKAPASTPDAMRFVVTSNVPQGGLYNPPLDRGYDFDRVAENPCVIVIGPFDGMPLSEEYGGTPNQYELEKRLLEVVKQWNSEAWNRHVRPTLRKAKP